MEYRVRATPEQLSMMLEFMETHGDLSRPVAGPQGRIKSDQLWSELTNLLHSVGGGVNKTTEKWKKVWADWKSKTKRKALVIRQHVRGAAGGPASRQILSAAEKRVLAIMVVSAVEGQAPVEELGFNRSQSPARDDLITDALCLEIVDESSQPSSSQPSNSWHLPTLSPQAPPSPAASATPPSAMRRPRLRSAGSLGRSRLAHHRRQGPSPFETAAREFTAVELRRLELEEMRIKLQHERDLRALEVEHERNQVFQSLVNVAQDWLDSYRSRDNTNNK